MNVGGPGVVVGVSGGTVLGDSGRQCPDLLVLTLGDSCNVGLVSLKNLLLDFCFWVPQAVEDDGIYRGHL